MNRLRRQFTALISAICVLLHTLPVAEARGVGVSPSKFPPVMSCTAPNPNLLKKLGSCSYPDEVNAFADQCHLANEDRGPSSRKLNTAKLSYLKLLFDREAMLLFRLYPVARYQSDWNKFKDKWTRRLAALPEIVELDNSTDLNPIERGALQHRLQNIETLHEKAAAAETQFNQLLGRTRDSGFFLLAAAVMLLTLNTQYTKDTYLAETNFVPHLASDMLTKERDIFQTMFPELVDGVEAQSVAQHLLDTHDKNIDQYARELLAPGSDGKYPRANQRFTHLLKMLNETLGDDPKLIQYGNDLTAVLIFAMHKIQATLDKDFDQIQTDPSLLLQDGLVTTAAILSLSEAGALTQQTLQVSQCQAIYHDQRWSTINSINSKYGGLAIDVLMVGMLAGGAVSLGSRFAISRMLGGPALRRMMLWSAQAGARVMSATGTTLMVAAAPWSALDFYYNYIRYSKVSRQFYETAAVDDKTRYTLDAVTGTKLTDQKSNIGWSEFNVILSLSPLAFL